MFSVFTAGAANAGNPIVTANSTATNSSFSVFLIFIFFVLPALVSFCQHPLVKAGAYSIARSGRDTSRLPFSAQLVSRSCRVLTIISLRDDSRLVVLCQVISFALFYDVTRTDLRIPLCVDIYPIPADVIGVRRVIVDAEGLSDRLG